MSRIKRLVAATLTMLLVTIGVAAATAAPAAASTDNAQCYSGYICFYEHAGYTGSEYDIYAGNSHGQCVSFGFGFWWDRASSVQNRSGGNVNLYSNAYCPGQGQLWMWNGMNIGDLWAYGLNDSIDAVYIQ
jgi:hypothetical protein